LNTASIEVAAILNSEEWFSLDGNNRMISPQQQNRLNSFVVQI